MSGWKNDIIKWRVSGRDHSKRQFGNLTTCNSAWMTKGVHHLGPIKGKKSPLDCRRDNWVKGKQCDLRIFHWTAEVTRLPATLFSSVFSLGGREATLPSHGERQNPSRHRLVQSHVTAPLAAAYSTRWLGNIKEYLHAVLAQAQPGCGGPLNVSALCLPLPFLSFHFWLNHQITVCLHSQVVRVLLCQAGALPKLSLSFVNFALVASGDKHLRRPTVREQRSPLSLLLWSTPESQTSSFPTHAMRISGERRQESSCGCIFTQPVCLFDTCRLWSTLENGQFERPGMHRSSSTQR